MPAPTFEPPTSEPPRFELLAVSDRATLGIPWPEWLAVLGASGIGALEIREKDLSDRALYDLALLSRSALPAGTAVLVNGRLDVALAAGAEGAHLPADGLPLAPLRRRFPRALLGRSTHTLEEVERAREEGADYVTFGPVYAMPDPAPGKKRYGPPTGLAGLRQAAARGIPVYALGGVTLERFREVAAAGAAGVAGIRMAQRIAGLPELARAARETFGRSRPPGG